MNIDNLPNPSFLLMSAEERFELIRSLRTARRVPTKTTKARAAAKRTSAKRKPAQPSLSAISDLTPDQAKALLEMLSNEND